MGVVCCFWRDYGLGVANRAAQRAFAAGVLRGRDTVAAFVSRGRRVATAKTECRRRKLGGQVPGRSGRRHAPLPAPVDNPKHPASNSTSFAGMNSLDALHAMAETSQEQWGLIRARQAVAMGVSRSQLAFLEQRGLLTRVKRGIYRMPGSEQHRLERLRANWLTVGGDSFLVGRSAIFARGYTTALAGRVDLAASKRFQGRDDDINVMRRPPRPDTVEIVDGLPVQKLEYAIIESWTLRNSGHLWCIALEAGLTIWDFSATDIRPSSRGAALQRELAIKQLLGSYTSRVTLQFQRLRPYEVFCECMLDDGLGVPGAPREYRPLRLPPSPIRARQGVPPPLYPLY